MNNLYPAITFPGSKTQIISLCMITHDISKQITQWDYKIRKLDGVGSKRDRHKISIHIVSLILLLIIMDLVSAILHHCRNILD